MREFLGHFFFLRLHSGEKKTLTSLNKLLDITFFPLRLHSSKEKSTRSQQNYSIVELEYFSASQQLGPARTPPRSPGRGLLQLDRPEAVTKHKLAIPTKGIVILISWEKSFKCKEADYSKCLTRPLLASCKGISPSP